MTTATIDPPFDLRATWRRWRVPIAMGVFLLVAAVVLAIVENAPPSRPLDPTDASPDGGRALATLVRDRGVDVVPVRDVAVTPIDAAATVFLPDPRSLSRSELATLSATASDLVVVAPGSRELQALDIGATEPKGGADNSRLSAGCDFGPAAVAGRLHYSGPTYVAPTAVAQCYPSGSADGLVVGTTPHGRVVIFGSPQTLTNDWLDDQGDAALGLGLLTRLPRLLWIVPRPPTQAPADEPHRGLLDLLPARVLWATLQVFVVVVLVALWRGRRLGPVVPEPLPVVVRATETVEGRARLLHAARAHDAAADALRASARERLRDRLGLAADSSPPAVVESVSHRCGWPAAEIQRILYGPAPTDDAALLRLTAELDQLDRAVRRSP
jgi:hypothetical protein